MKGNLSYIIPVRTFRYILYFLTLAKKGSNYSKEPDGTFKIINITINSEINFKEFEFFLKAKKRNKKINQILN